MVQGKICALALGLIGMWLTWNAGDYIQASTVRGFGTADIFTPEFVARCVIAGLVLLSGLAGLFSLRLGSWLGGLATFVMALLAYLLISAADVSLWADDALLLFAIMAIWMGMIAARGHIAADR
ncbi:MAG: hypothetical protein AAF950_14945 [Pseudomonadota bacterium]